MDQHQPERITWGAGIIYDDGRPCVMIYVGPSRLEADSIARTYKDTAESEGGRVAVAGVDETDGAWLIEAERLNASVAA